jgi:hypothetical protein
MYVFLVGVSGCLGPVDDRYQRTAVFVEEEYAPYVNPGTASLSGSAFMKTRGGDVKVCAGNNISMQPKSSHSDEWFAHAILRYERMTPPDPKVANFVRTTVGDARGDFKFLNVAAGKYYIVCKISWLSRTGKGGGTAFAQITIEEGEHLTNVVVTR